MKTNQILGGSTQLSVMAISLLFAADLSQAQAPAYQYPPQQGYPQRYSAPTYPGQQPSYSQPGYNQAPAYQPQQGYAQPGYQTEYVSPMEFLPTFGRKFGSMFRRVFYGDAPPQGYSQPAPSNPGYPQYQGRNLDTAPPPYASQYGQPQQPAPYQQPAMPQYQQPATPQYQQPPTPSQQRYETPPPPLQQQQPTRSTAPTLPPGTRMGSSSTPRTSPPKTSSPQKNSTSSAKKYTPPTISRNTSKPKVQDSPPKPKPQNEEVSAPPSSNTQFYPLPGSQPDVASNSKSTPKTTPKSNSTSANSGGFLKGKRASKEGRVISPYPPYQELDVTGLSSGSLALDPTTQKVFEVP